MIEIEGVDINACGGYALPTPAFPDNNCIFRYEQFHNLTISVVLPELTSALTVQDTPSFSIRDTGGLSVASLHMVQTIGCFTDSTARVMNCPGPQHNLCKKFSGLVQAIKT